MGPPTSPNLSAVGDNVNIAARLESETKTHGCTLIVSTALAGARGRGPVGPSRPRGRAPRARRLRVGPRHRRSAGAPGPRQRRGLRLEGGEGRVAGAVVLCFVGSRTGVESDDDRTDAPVAMAIDPFVLPVLRRTRRRGRADPARHLGNRAGSGRLRARSTPPYRQRRSGRFLKLTSSAPTEVSVPAPLPRGRRRTGVAPVPRVRRLAFPAGSPYGTRHRE